MKRLNTSDDDDFVSKGTEEKRSKKKKGQIYSREFQAMLDGLDDQDGEAEEMGGAVVGAGDKKRRLSSEQVKALEKSFEVENKLEPERKNQLAEELGLEPRQVAIWFQNRRARFKTKQLERDYGILKADYDSLNLDFDHLQQENQALLAEVRELKMKLNQEIADSNVVLYAAAAAAAKEEEEEDQSPASESVTTAGVAINGIDKEFDILAHAIKEDPTTQYDDGKLIASFHQNSSPFLNWIHFSNSRAAAAAAEDEQQSFGNTEESCNFFSVDHAPTLHRYFPQ